MRKIMLFLCCCSISAYCISQSQNRQDSSNARSDTVYKAKDNTPDTRTAELTIFPNPAKNKITIQVKNFKPGMASVKILDIKGKLVRADNRLITNGTDEIIMFLMLKAGIYFILVNEPGKEARKKLVVL